MLTISARIALGQERLRDPLVERAVALGRGQRVGAGEVDDLDTPAGVLVLARFFLDRYARPVADPLARAGKNVEQGRLATIRVADQADYACRHS